MVRLVLFRCFAISGAKLLADREKRRVATMGPVTGSTSGRVPSPGTPLTYRGFRADKCWPRLA